MKRLTRITTTILLLVAVAVPANAGMAVFDASNLAQAVLQYVQQINTAVNTAEQLSTQYRQLEIELQQARQLNSDQIRGRILNGIRQLADIQRQTRGITYEYGNLQTTFDQHYPDMPTYNGMSGRDYAAQATKANQQLQNSVRDAMQAQGLISNAASDQDALNALVLTSNTAEGQLAAVQAGNQIAAMTAQQLIQLQQIMATSAREQSSYMAAQAAAKAKKVTRKDPNRAYMKDSGKNMLDYLNIK